MRMCGTVKCRPTLAYRVHFDSINISECTDFNEKLALADIKPTFGECAVLAGKALTVNMLEVNCFWPPIVAQPFVSQHKAHMREMVNAMGMKRI